MKSNLIMETYFNGTMEDWLNQIPEHLIDQSIEILSINPDEKMEPKGYSPVNNDAFPRTVKICLWKDLVHVIHRWGMPSPTQMQTSPSNLRKHTNDIKTNITNALKTLKDLEYQEIFEKGTMSNEFKTGYGLRQVSEVLRVNKEGGRGHFISPNIIKQAYEEKGEWEKHYPFDYDIDSATKTLENIMQYINKLLGDPSHKVPARGTKKKGKDNYDTLVWALCHIYKKYTGEKPTSSAREDGTASGKIIPFLQLTLNQSSYSYEKTDWALEKKIRELKIHPTHGELWQDAKN